MQELAHPDSITERPIKPAVAALRFADGAVVEDATPFAQVLTPPINAKRGRKDEVLFFVFNPASGIRHGLCRDLLDIVRETYWSASGSVTAALRRSASIANRYLFEHNLNVERSDRCYGGLGCAVLRDRDLFLLQAGPVWSCVLQEKQLRCFPRGEKLAHMGIGPLADVRLYHVSAALGDTLLLAPHTLLRDADEAGLRRLLSLSDVGSIATGLEQWGSDRFAVLVARWEPASETSTAQPQPVSQIRRTGLPPLPTQDAVGRGESHDKVEQDPWIVGQDAPQPGALHAKETQPAQEQSPYLEEARPNVGIDIQPALRRLGSFVSHVWHGFAAVGAGGLALGRWLGGAIGMTIRSMLPGSQRTAPRHARHHPPPEENRTVMMAIAVAIPIVVLAVVLVAYRQFAVESRLQGLINQAKEQIALAQAAEADSATARRHWEQALEQAEAAATLQPDDPTIQVLHDQAQQALDQLDRIERLELTPLVDFGSSNEGRRLVLHDQMLFVLDRKDGWAAHVPLNDVGREATEDELEPSQQSILMHTGQQINGEEVGSLIDATWVDAEGGRQSSTLLVLGGNSQLFSHDPAWRSESGEPQLSLLELNSSLVGQPVAVGSYRGRFYILDATAEGIGQIWRYNPQGNAYPNPPERYFSIPPPQSLEQTIDMAIDGHIYILHQDGRVQKFLGGEIQPFEIGDVPGGLEEVTGFAVDPDGDGSIYIADRGNDRVVLLGPDGRFQSQLLADPPLTFLEALAVDQEDRRLYVLAAGQVYAAALP